MVKKFRQKEEIENFQEVQIWLKSVSENSRQHYIYAMKKFCEFSGLMPNEIITLRVNELGNRIKNTSNIHDLILGFRLYLEKKGYAAKTINSLDGALRGFFTSILGKDAKIIVENYYTTKKRNEKVIIPSLEELGRILDVCNIEERFRIIFLAQTGMRIQDALALKVSNIQGELEIGKIPLTISYTPVKACDGIGKRITFLGIDGVEIMKAYFRLRKDLGEKFSNDSPLFVSRTKRGKTAIQPEKINEMIRRISKKAAIIDSSIECTLKATSFRKFFIMQMQNCGVQNIVIDFFVGNAMPEIDRVFWSKRTEELRQIYGDNQQHLNPSSIKNNIDFSKVDELKAKIEQLEIQIALISSRKILVEEFESRIVSTETEIIKLSNMGWECQQIGSQKWLMRHKLNIGGDHSMDEMQ